MHEKNYSNNTTPIDSIVIIYRSIEMAFDDLKITVSPSNSDIRFIKSFFDKLQHIAKPQRLCEWQRKEIFDTLVGIYVTGSIKIGTGKKPTGNAYYSTPPEMYVTIYSHGNIQKEHLTIYDIDDDDEFKYSDEFDHLRHLLAVLLLVFRDGLPIVC